MEYTKQVIHSAIVHLLSNAQPVHVQQPLPGFPPHLYTDHNRIWYGSLGVNWPGCISSQLLLHPQPLCWQGGVRSWKVLDSV